MIPIFSRFRRFSTCYHRPPPYDPLPPSIWFFFVMAFNFSNFRTIHERMDQIEQKIEKR